MKKMLIVLALVSVGFFAPGCGKPEGPAHPAESGAGLPAATAHAAAYHKALDFELPDLDGKPVRLSDYAGKVIILNFFATWCPPCLREMPDFNELAAEYKGKLAVVAVNVGRESVAGLRDFARAHNFTFPILRDNGSVTSLYGPMPGIPVTVIIDRDFNVARRFIGMRSKGVFLAEIKGLL